MLFLLLACDGGESAADAPTFTADIQTDLVNSCGFSSCHGGSAGGLTLDGSEGDYLALVDAAASTADGETLVIPGDAANSYLYKILVGDGIEGDLMPPPDGGWDQDKIDAVAAWIDAGAPE